tara:strand:- start:2018 stop:2602 length:585 start_codon:yes stop_codon:yes gene_type:complete
MPVSFSLSADCKTLQVSGAPSGATYTLFHNDFESPSQIYELLDPTQPYNGNVDPATGLTINGYVLNSPVALNGSGATELTFLNISTATEESLNGVFMIVIQDPVDPATTFTAGVVGHCDIDCCIASKLTELIDCSCDEECSKALDVISKIYLLIQGAKVNTTDCLQTPDQFKKAYKKYLKAKSMCSTNECNCNC